MSDTFRMSAVFVRACELGAAQGWKNIASLPGCAELQIDEQWWFALNPHQEEIKCSKGAKVPPCAIYFTFNEWPAGYCNAGGGLLAAGVAANEDALLEAIEAAIEKIGGPRWEEA
jgi:hypothetical protein